MNNREAALTVLHYLERIRRPGAERLIDFIRSSNYLSSAKCYGHHHCYYGLMFHSLEVLDYMLKNNRHGLQEDSIVLAALCHDLGKATQHGKKVGRVPHYERSLYIVNNLCGVELTYFEASAIRDHHKSCRTYEEKCILEKNPLLRLLRQADACSTHVNKRGETYRLSSIVKR